MGDVVYFAPLHPLLFLQIDFFFLSWSESNSSEIWFLLSVSEKCSLNCLLRSIVKHKARKKGVKKYLKNKINKKMGIRIKPIGGQQASMYKLNARKQHESHVFSFIPPFFFFKVSFPIWSIKILFSPNVCCCLHKREMVIPSRFHLLYR